MNFFLLQKLSSMTSTINHARMHNNKRNKDRGPGLRRLYLIFREWKRSIDRLTEKNTARWIDG